MYSFEAYRSVADPTDIARLQAELQHGFGPAVEPLAVDAARVDLLDRPTSVRIVREALQTAWRDPELTSRGVLSRITERASQKRAQQIAVLADVFSLQKDGDAYTLSLKCRQESDGFELVQDREEIVKAAFDDSWPRLISELAPFEFSFPIARVHDEQVAEEIGYSRPMRAYDIHLGQLAIVRPAA